jgi:LysM repeat protein
MDQRTRRSPARFLAPLALIAVLLAFFTIVNGSGESDTSGDDSSGTSAPTTTTTSKSGSKSTTTAAKKKAKAKAKTYTIQVGDTLGGIADKTGVSLATLEELNPDVDPQAMVAGQKIKLE